MLPGMSSTGSATSPSVPASVTYTGRASTTGDDPTFSAAAIGTAAANRYIVVAVSSMQFSEDSPGAHTTVSVAGTSCTKVAEMAVNNSTDQPRQSLWITNSAVTTGTTGDIVINTGANTSYIGAAAWAVYGITSNTPTDTATDGGNPSSSTIDHPEGGIIIAAATTQDLTPSQTSAWTGATEDFEGTNGVQGFTGASAANLTAATGQTISVSITGGNAGDAMVAATWS